jgi:hypothetical protein
MLPISRASKHYSSAHKWFLKPAIENFFKTEFTKSFGPNVRSFIADELIKIFQENNRETNSIKPGQVLWNAVHKDTRSTSHNMKLVPVVLTLINDEDISKLEKGLKISEHKQNVVARMLDASKNILKEGLKIYGKGLAITKVERKSDFSDKAYSMKPETH